MTETTMAPTAPAANLDRTSQDRTRVGSVADLRRNGRIIAKVGSLPVMVVWHAGEAFAIEDRCPHLGFPLHQGTIDSGMVTCHWHHARFDLTSGCTLDPWADDAIGFAVAFEGDDVMLTPHPMGDPLARLTRRLRAGMEQNLPIVIAKSVLGLCEREGGEANVLDTLYRFGLERGGDGWGAGLTVATCLARTLDHLAPADRALALIHAVSWVTSDVGASSPRFELGGLPVLGQPVDRLLGWFRSFVETRGSDGAERSLATAVDSPGANDAIERAMFAALTDHVFVDVGHTLDFTNKAFEADRWIPPTHRSMALTSVVGQMCRAGRSEELSEWNHPHDLAGLAVSGGDRLGASVRDAAAPADDAAIAAVGWAMLDAEPDAVADLVIGLGGTLENKARAVAFAAALRMVRFHVSNDVADWNTVHHTFTFANAVHQAVRRHPTEELARGVMHAALRVFLDRFLNVPAARTAPRSDAAIADLQQCWDRQGCADEAGSLVIALCEQGRQAEVTRALGAALLQEDADFHLYQSFDAAVAHASSWQHGSTEAALTLAGHARFLAAYTPTRRERSTVVRTAQRLLRGEDLTAD